MQRKSDSGPGPLFHGTVIGLVFSFRLISLPLLIASLVVARRLGTRSRWTVALRCTFFVSLLSPVDVNLLGCYKEGGTHRLGLRFVRCVVGLPAHTALLAKYGEYYTLGCSAYTLNNPTWMLTLY